MKNYLVYTAFLFGALLSVASLSCVKVAVEVEVSPNVRAVTIGDGRIAPSGRSTRLLIGYGIPLPAANNVPTYIIIQLMQLNEDARLLINLHLNDGAIKADAFVRRGTICAKLYGVPLPAIAKAKYLLCKLSVWGSLIEETEIESLELVMTDVDEPNDTDQQEDTNEIWRTLIAKTIEEAGISVWSATSDESFKYTLGSVRLQVGGGYIRILPLFQGKRPLAGTRHTVLGRDIRIGNCRLSEGPQQVSRFLAWQTLKNLAQQYQIYCMPDSVKSLTAFLELFFEELKEDEELQEALHSIAILPLLYEGITNEILNAGIVDAEGHIRPLMTFYPASGKHHAQKVLNTLYKLSSQENGLPLRPPFSERISDFLLYTQGSQDDKLTGAYQGCFEQPGRCFYAKNFETLRVTVGRTITDDNAPDDNEAETLETIYFGADPSQGTICKVLDLENYVVQQENNKITQNYRLEDPS